MQTLNLFHKQMFKRTDGVQQSFWRRQFSDSFTRGQVIFDVMFGVVLPILCFLLDPIVFKGGLIGEPDLVQFRALAYLMSGLAIVALALWLATGMEGCYSSAVAAGIFFTG